MAGNQGMARRLGRLRAKQIEILGPGRYHDGGGLYLVVGAGNARSWIFRFRKHGKLHDYGLGPVRVIGLAKAREKAAECRVALYSDTNPVEARKTMRLERVLAEAKRLVFRQAATRFIDAHAAGWRNRKSEAQWRQSLEMYVFPVLGDMPVQAIDTPAVMRVLEPIWNEKTETASRIRSRIEAVLDWAAAQGYRSGDNPARWKGLFDKLLPSRAKVRPVAHHAAMPYAKIGEFTAQLRQTEGVATRALEFLILAAARSGEVLGAQWGEVNLTERTWTIPASRMKAGREHRVPLTDRMLAILDEMATIQTNRFVFPGTRRNAGLGPMALRRVLGLCGHTEFAVHGFRSTFRDWAGETTSFAREVVEMALAHGIANKTEAAYQRGDLFTKRRQLMAAWDAYCAALRQRNTHQRTGS